MDEEQAMIVRAARVEDAGGIAKVHVDSWRTTYKGVIPDDFLASLSYESRSQRWRSMLSNPTRFAGDFVAEDKTGRIVGFISGGPAQEPYPVYRGELYAIYILQEYQGQEIGRRLTEALVGKLLEAGIDNMLVWVLRRILPASSTKRSAGDSSGRDRSRLAGLYLMKWLMDGRILIAYWQLDRRTHNEAPVVYMLHPHFPESAAGCL